MTSPFGSTNFSQRLRHAALRVSSFARRPRSDFEQVRASHTHKPAKSADEIEEQVFNELSSEIYQNSINTCDSPQSTSEINRASSTQVILSLQNKTSSQDKNQRTAS